MDEENQYGDSQEETSQESTQNKPDFSAEFAAMKAELESLKSAQFAQSQDRTPVIEQKQVPQLTAEQAQALKDNPALMASWLQAQAETAKNEIRKESAKQVWDKKTYDKYPLLNTDKEFGKRVTTQMREMISQGEYGKDDPMLLYRAAQIAAAEYIPTRNASKSSQGMSSVESRQTNRGDAPKTKIDDNDPRLQFAKVLGLTGDKLAKFKAGLSAYVPSQRRQTRSFRK